MIIGVFMFVFYLFTPPPMLFNRVHDERVRGSARAAEYAALEQKFNEALSARAVAAQQLADAGNDRRHARRVLPPSTRSEQRVKDVRAEAIALVEGVSAATASYNDINYVFPTYIVTQLPVGLIGLLMAAIFAAAMSTIAGELSALSTSTVIDFYTRWIRDDGDETHLLRVSKFAMLFWAVFASRRGDLGRRARIADRSRQPLWIVLLRIDPRRVPAGDRLEARATAPARSSALIAGMSVVGYVTLNTTHRVSLAQPDRRRRRVRRRHDRQRAHRSQHQASGTRHQPSGNQG